MNYRKCIALLLLSVTFVSSALMAQQNDSFPSDRKKGSGEPPKQLTATERAELKSNQLQQALGLDEAQHKQVLKLYKKLFRNEESDKESQGMDGGPGFGNTGPRSEERRVGKECRR